MCLNFHIRTKSITFPRGPEKKLKKSTFDLFTFLATVVISIHAKQNGP